jgi:predicted RNA-binding Zn-ribbon protein involved in translation (DUF1610 family)
MKTCEEHCLHTLKRYGLAGKDIHEWMDAPVQVAGPNHRRFRHNTTRDLETAHLVFDKKYGARLVENIFLDHIIADSPKKRQKGKQADEDELIKTLPGKKYVKFRRGWVREDFLTIGKLPIENELIETKLKLEETIKSLKEHPEHISQENKIPKNVAHPEPLSLNEDKRPKLIRDIDELGQEIKRQNIVTVYTCPQCGQNVRISKETDFKGPITCKKCSYDLANIQLAGFLKAILAQ